MILISMFHRVKLFLHFLNIDKKQFSE